MRNIFSLCIRKCFFHWKDPSNNVKLHGWKNIHWRSVIELLFIHIGALSVFYVGVSKVAFISFLIVDILGGFFVTVILHRYFTHRCFETSRIPQFIFGLLSLTVLQRGPLWWVSHHRRHHHFTDTDDDPHTPKKGFFYSHLGWLMTLNEASTDKDHVKDWIRFPELIWLDRLEWLAPVFMILSAFYFGVIINHFFPHLGTSGLQMIVWLVCIPTMLVLHGSCLVNSCLHTFGYRRFNTPDNSRNALLFTLISFGEGFHNNHHRYHDSCCQGIEWWEIDITYYMIKLLAKIGIIWNLRMFPDSVLQEGKNILPKESCKNLTKIMKSWE